MSIISEILQYTHFNNKILELPENWDQICSESSFPNNFDIWNYFFQHLFTERCKSLISQKISTINDEICKYVISMLEDLSNNSNSEQKLKNSIWIEDSKDNIKMENNSYKSNLKIFKFYFPFNAKSPTTFYLAN